MSESVNPDLQRRINDFIGRNKRRNYLEPGDYIPIDKQGLVW